MSTTSASDHDMSDSSSPLSYNRSSPSSSPSQQMPHIVNGLHELSCVDKRQFLQQANRPSLKITEQPQNHFRFRYVSEMTGTHGCLLGKSYSSNKTKTHPSVELINFSGQAVIRCSLAQANNDNEHPHKLLEDEQDRDLSYIVPDQGSYKVGFGGIGIIHTAKKDVAALLYKKYSEKMKSFNAKELQAQCESMAKNINLNIVRLKFSAHDTNSGMEICEPVFSEPIHNMKSASTNDLKICRISRSSGSASGGEDVYILVEKVNKKNIIIRFFELDENGDRVWHSDGTFMQSDVHHQYAIVFRTPPYKDPNTTVDVKVYIELVRPSDGRCSEPKEFKYKKNVFAHKKRKATSSYCSIGSSSSGSLNSTCDIPITVMNQVDVITQEDAALRDVMMREEAMKRDIILRDEAMKRDIMDVSKYLVPQVPETVADQCNTVELANALFSSPASNYSQPGSDSTHSPLSSPMWGAQLNSPPLPLVDLHLQSGELEHIGEAKNESNLQQYLSEYVKTFGDNLDEKNSMEFIRSLLMTDSGRAKVGAMLKADTGRPKVAEKHGTVDTNAQTDNKKMKTEYPAFYKTQDGVEVKQLVKEICEMIRNKKGFKKQDVRNKLEQLFDIRLSNGDTFLHMTLCSNEPTLEYIVKIIHTVKATHLLDCHNDKQQTTLHLAVMNDMPKMVKLLIAKGANPMMKDEDNLNAIHYAVKYGTCLECLLDAIKEHGVPCDLDEYNNEQQTALHMAASLGRAAHVRALLAAGAGAEARDAELRTALHLAAYDARAHVAAALLDHVPQNKIDMTDGAGNTALQIVCGACSVTENTVAIAKLLLEKKANPIVKQEGGCSAWHLVKDKPVLKELLHKYVVAEYMEEDDVKSEPEDEYESADEEEYGLSQLPQYTREVSALVDASGAWRALAERVRLDGMLSWFSAQPSPTHTLLYQLKETRDDITSKSLALILEDIGQTEAAAIIRRYLD